MMVLEPLLRVAKIAARGLPWPLRIAACVSFLLVPLAPPGARALEPAAPQSTPPGSGVAPTARPAPASADLERVRLAAAIEQLQARVGHHSVRVWAAGKRLVVQRPVFDSLGIHPSAARHTGEVGTQPMIAWHDVRRIDVRGSNFVRGAVLGGLAFAVPYYASSYHGSEDSPGIIAIPAVLIGGVIGAFSGHWSRIHGWPPPALPRKQVASASDTTRTARAPLAPSVLSPTPGKE